MRRLLATIALAATAGCSTTEQPRWPVELPPVPQAVRPTVATPAANWPPPPTNKVWAPWTNVFVVASNDNAMPMRWVVEKKTGLGSPWAAFATGTVNPYTNFWAQDRTTNASAFYRAGWVWP